MTMHRPSAADTYQRSIEETEAATPDDVITKAQERAAGDVLPYRLALDIVRAWWTAGHDLEDLPESLTVADIFLALERQISRSIWSTAQLETGTAQLNSGTAQLTADTIVVPDIDPPTTAQLIENGTTTALRKSLCRPLDPCNSGLVILPTALRHKK